MNCTASIASIGGSHNVILPLILPTNLATLPWVGGRTVTKASHLLLDDLISFSHAKQWAVAKVTVATDC